MEQNFSLTPVHTDKQIQEISILLLLSGMSTSLPLSAYSR